MTREPEELPKVPGIGKAIELGKPIPVGEIVEAAKDAAQRLMNPIEVPIVTDVLTEAFGKSIKARPFGLTITGFNVSFGVHITPQTGAIEMGFILTVCCKNNMIGQGDIMASKIVPNVTPTEKQALEVLNGMYEDLRKGLATQARPNNGGVPKQ